MSSRRVFVTGVGVVSALGLTGPDHFRRLLAGESGVVTLDNGEYQAFPPLLQAPVAGYDRREHISNRMLRKLLSASSAYAVTAAGEALRDAGLTPDASNFREAGLYVGSVCLDVNPEAFIPALRESIDGNDAIDLARFATHGMRLIDPLFLVKSLPNAGLCGIAIEHQILGPNLNITNGAVSGLQAIISAAAAIRRGEVELGLAGGYDSLLQMDNIVEHLLAGRLSTSAANPASACRPFDRASDGYALGEGGAFIVLESAAHARQRSARVYAEILSAGQSTCAHRLLGTHTDGIESLVEAGVCALEAGHCDPGEIDVIFGDGLATIDDDLAESQAVRSLVPGARPQFTAATGAIGFVGAASGAFSLVHAALATYTATIPPLINCVDPIAGCAMDLVDAARTTRVKRALVWNSDRRIKNAAVLLGDAA